MWSADLVKLSFLSTLVITFLYDELGELRSLSPSTRQSVGLFVSNFLRVIDLVSLFALAFSLIRKNIIVLYIT